MRSPARLLVVTSVFLAGCGTARDVAVTSFRVIDAPAQFIRRKIDPGTTTTTTTTTVQTGRGATSDVVTPGRPVIAPTPPPRIVARSRSVEPSRTTPPPRSTASTASTTKRSTPAPTPRPSASTTVQFPTAKPVPGKPGFVYSIDPKGGIVDVTGYKSGDKAKDPYTQKIFIIP